MITIRFAIIGGGLMGREFATAVARWATLLEPAARPEIVAVASRTPRSLDWFTSHFPSVRQATTDWREVLKNDAVDAVYVAVPHDLHEETYVAALDAGKHLLGEKPFGIDLAANEAILAAARRRPERVARCSSEFPFYPGAQKACDLIESGALGRIIEVQTGFLHSSDLDPNKPINWKRQAATNGAYGCMGDLGMHVCHVPFRAGWRPRNTRAVLSNLMPQRPDGRGGAAASDTWDNATLLSEASDGGDDGNVFPWTLKTYRIAPGERNTWYLEVYGTRASARWSTREPKALDVLRYEPGGEQNWTRVQVAFDPPFRTITGPNFEFGFPDCFLQMVAAFVHELAHGRPLKRFAGCVTPEETHLSHQLFTAALRSQAEGAVVAV
ncbi:MAG TPA: Gfo/Idh/MocA family oxidoreductase [Tepidisphaeraceae bacterium]|nr:Gfo/Idh/MocA family oxidoreductase [Tepidisphaeraceae bacterium]